MSGKVTVVVGGQYGSEAKGHVTAKLVEEYSNLGERNMVVRVGGPNAGHSAVGVLDGKNWSMRQIPIAAVRDLEATLVIAQGSEIDEPVLVEEIQSLDAAGYKVSERLVVDQSATMIYDEHKERETNGRMPQDAGLIEKIGSTGKGIGAARAARAWREADQWGDFPDTHFSADTPPLIAKFLESGGHVTVEGVQGYGLGTHAGEYPFCTTTDCRAIDFLAMAGISPWAPWVKSIAVWVVLRTFPIRVAGNSGDLYEELSWDQMRGITGIADLEPERTTVTKKIRRVGRFDYQQAWEAIRENGGNVNVAVTFMDYIDSHLRETGELGFESQNFLRALENRLAGRSFATDLEIWPRVRMITWGPDKSMGVETVEDDFYLRSSIQEVAR